MNLAATKERIKQLEAEILQKNDDLANLYMELSHKRIELITNCPHPAEFLVDSIVCKSDQYTNGLVSRTCTICGGTDIIEANLNEGY